MTTPRLFETTCPDSQQASTVLKAACFAPAFLAGRILPSFGTLARPTVQVWLGDFDATEANQLARMGFREVTHQPLLNAENN